MISCSAQNKLARPSSSPSKPQSGLSHSLTTPSTAPLPAMKRTSRLPESLKQVFVESQKGHEVNEPPEDKSAFQTFEDSNSMSHVRNSKHHPLPNGLEKAFLSFPPPASEQPRQRPSSERPCLVDLVVSGTTVPPGPEAEEAEWRNQASPFVSEGVQHRDSNVNHQQQTITAEDPSKNKRLVDILSKVEMVAAQTLHEPKQEDDEEFPSQRRRQLQGRRASATSAASSHKRPLLSRSTSFTMKKSTSTCPSDKTCSSPPTKPPTLSYPSMRSPQIFLDVMLRTLGYSTECYPTLETSYFNKPTNLQMVSNHTRLHNMLRDGRHREQEEEQKQQQGMGLLGELLSSGLSPNPCNSHGESLLHAACRLGCPQSVKTMLQCGTSIQVSNDFGRTPLHEAMFSASVGACFFDLIDLLLKNDRHLLHLRDRHGATPLSFVPRAQWGIWIDFLYAKRHDYFPKRNKREDGIAPCSQRMQEAPDSRPIPDPPNALPLDVASLVASGRLSSEEAQYLIVKEGEYDTSRAEETEEPDDDYTTEDCIEISFEETEERSETLSRAGDSWNIDPLDDECDEELAEEEEI